MLALFFINYLLIYVQIPSQQTRYVTFTFTFVCCLRRTVHFFTWILNFCLYLISYFLKWFACQQSIQLYYALIFVDGRAIAVFRLLEFVVWLWFLYAIECEKSNNNNNNISGKPLLNVVFGWAAAARHMHKYLK